MKAYLFGFTTGLLLGGGLLAAHILVTDRLSQWWYDLAYSPVTPVVISLTYASFTAWLIKRDRGR